MATLKELVWRVGGLAMGYFKTDSMLKRETLADWPLLKDCDPVEIINEVNRSIALFFNNCFGLMDRGFVFNCIHCYHSALLSCREDEHAVLCRFALLDILSGYEHYIQLNLPLHVTSLDHSIPELNPAFLKEHYLVGLVLKQAEEVFDPDFSTSLRLRAIGTLRNVLNKHDFDSRYDTPDWRSRLALLYTPFVNIVLRHVEQLYSPSQPRLPESKGALLDDTTDEIDARCDISATKDILLSVFWVLKNTDTSVLSYIWRQQGVNVNLFTILQRALSIFCYVGKEKLFDMAATENNRLDLGSMETSHKHPTDGKKKRTPSTDDIKQQPVSSLARAASTKDHGVSRVPATPVTGPSTTRPESSRYSMKRDISLATLALSARRVRPVTQFLDPPPTPANSARVVSVSAAMGVSRPVGNLQFFTCLTPSARNREEILTEIVLEQNMSTGIILVVLEMVDFFFFGFPDLVVEGDELTRTVCHVLLEMVYSKNPNYEHPVPRPPTTETSTTSNTPTVLLGSSGTGQNSSSTDEVFLRDKKSRKMKTTLVTPNRYVCIVPEILIPHMFEIWHAVIEKYPNILFSRPNGFSQELCLKVLYGCNSRSKVLRQNAAAFLCILLRTNISRISLSATVAMSEFVGEGGVKVNNDNIVNSLQLVSRFAGQYFPEMAPEVSKFMELLHNIVVDTREMNHYKWDPEMFTDLQYRIAKSYSGSIILRLTWLKNMAKDHMRNENWSEAAMCAVQCASIVAEYLKLEGNSLVIDGCFAFEKISPNCLEEMREVGNEDKDNNDKENATSSPLLSERGFLTMLNETIYLLKKAQRYELVSRIYQVVTPFWERDRRYDLLLLASKDMSFCFETIETLKTSKKRFLGFFYRIGFYGKIFKKLSGCEYIYKEPHVTPLGQVMLRLQSMYGKEYGEGRIKIIQDPGVVNYEALNPDVGHIQITFVEPYFTDAEKIQRTNYFEENHNISQFVFETMLTTTGKAQGTVAEQRCRRTVLHVGEGFTFPYVKKR